MPDTTMKKTKNVTCMTCIAYILSFQSYCLKHSKKKPVEGSLGPNTVDVTPQKSPHSTPKKEKTNEEKANERAIK